MGVGTVSSSIIVGSRSGCSASVVCSLSAGTALTRAHFLVSQFVFRIPGDISEKWVFFRVYEYLVNSDSSLSFVKGGIIVMPFPEWLIRFLCVFAATCRYITQLYRSTVVRLGCHLIKDCSKIVDQNAATAVANTLRIIESANLMQLKWRTFVNLTD